MALVRLDSLTRMAIDVTDATFQTEVVDRSHQAVVLVDLWAPWCRPCLMVAPLLETLAVERAGKVKVVKVNVDEAPMIAQQYKAQSIPMVLIMDGGTVVDTLIGAQPGPMYRSRVDGALARR